MNWQDIKVGKQYKYAWSGDYAFSVVRVLAKHDQSFEHSIQVSHANWPCVADNNGDFDFSVKPSELVAEVQIKELP